jgi:hypothetical protein
MAKTSKKPAVNYTIPINHNGKHYLGVSLHDGVDFGLIDAPCGSARQLIQFKNCSDAPTGLFWDGVTCSDDKSPAVKEYLQLKPDTAQAA